MAAAQRVFDSLAQGVYRAHVHAEYALADAAQAHADMEAGRHVGSIVLRT